MMLMLMMINLSMSMKQASRGHCRQINRMFLLLMSLLSMITSGHNNKLSNHPKHPKQRNPKRKAHNNE